MSQSVVLRSFSAGELAPSIGARADLPKYTIAARTVRNFLVQKHGGVANRPGLAFIERVKGGIAYRAAVLARAPTNYWRLNEAGSGTVAYDLGSGLDNGTYAGSPTQGTVMAYGGVGVTFDGVNDQVTYAGVAASTTTFTVSAWLRPGTPGATNASIFSDTPSGTTNGLYLSTANLPTLYVNGAAVLQAPALTVGSEHLVTIVVTAGVAQWYIDGVASGGTVGSVISWTPTETSTTGSRFTGVLSDLAYWSGVALTANQIAALYAARYDTQVQLLKYLADDPNESILIEAGAGYLRFYKDGAQVNISAPTAWSNATAYTAGDLVSLAGINYYCILAHTNQSPPNATYWYALTGTIYEIPTPFASGFRWNQSGAVITLTNTGVAPYELIYLSLTRWVLQAVAIAPASPTPTNVTAAFASTPGPQADQYQYAVTAGAPGSFEESLAGVSARASANPPTATGPNVITWDAMTYGGVACPEYYVYRDSTKSLSRQFLGTARTNVFLDTGLAEDPALTPPINDIDLTSSANRPALSAFHQQRRFFANTTTTPDAIWGSRVGQRSNFCRSSPLQDDDSLTIRIAQNQNHPVRHLVSVAAGLIVFTAGGEHRIISADGPGGPISPNSLDAIQDLYVGASDVVPEVIGNSVIYVQARGKVVRDVQYNQEVEGLAGRDLTLLAGHFFEKYTINAIAYQQNDHSILWAVRSDGTLLGMTYIREQDIWGWHRHDSYTRAGQSVFESICVVPEDHEDVLYAIVARSINGSTVRLIERLETRVITDLATNAMFLDCSLSRVTGGAISTLTGLSHLEGETIGVVGDGVYLGTFTVASGQVVLGASYSKIHAGLLFTSDLETLDLDVAGGDIRDRKKRVGSVSMLLQDSNRQIQVGINEATLTAYTPGEAESPATAEFSGLVELPVITEPNYEGRVFIRQATPLPLTILGVIPRVEMGA